MKNDFFWGVATSAFQSEGGYDGPGQPRTNWAAAQASGDVARTGNSSEFWIRYREDFERCRAMGLNAFRLGIEWSRVQPVFDENSDTPPDFDLQALDQYADIFAECRRYGMEPVVTLQHFVHPGWLGADPWLTPGTPELFVRYVERALTHINERLTSVHGNAPLRYFITINEPNMLVLNTYLGYQFPGASKLGVESVTGAFSTLLVTHVRAYNAIHDLYAGRGWPSPQVTLNNYCSDLYWCDKVLLDLLSLAERRVPRDQVREHIHAKIDEFQASFAAARIPLHKDLPFYIGSLFKRTVTRTGYKWFDPERLAPALDAIYSSPRARVFDYLGLDYYDPFTAHAFRLPVFWDHEFKNKSFRSWVLNTITSKWWDWRVLPRGLHFFCQHYSADFGNRPVLIAENGMAHRRRPDNSNSRRRDRISRSQFLRLHVHEVTRIVNDGIPLIGYLHWSLVDNYEWGSFTPRFGLYSLDYTQGADRLVEDHTGDRPSETYAALIREARARMRS